MTYWLNGEWKDDIAAISVTDRGFLLGDGLFETLYVESGVPAFLDAHLSRLQASMGELHMQPPDLEDLPALIRELTARNGLDKRASVRFTITRKGEQRGLPFPENSSLSTLLTAAPAPPAATDSLPMIVSRYCRSARSIASRCKTINYLDNVLARHEASDQGADEAVMLNEYGRIACASSANIFVFAENGAISTPPVSEGALPGIVRGLLFEAADELGFELLAAPLLPEQLDGAATFLTNSLIGLRLAHLAPGRAAKKTQQLEIFKKLEAWYQARLREEIEKRTALA